MGIESCNLGYIKIDYNETIGAWILKNTELYEVSVVSIPANPEAVFDIVKSYGENHKFNKPSTNNVPNKNKSKEIDMNLEELQAKLKEMETKLSKEEAEKARLLEEKRQKELEEKEAKERAEREAIKEEIKGVDEKVGKVSELIESITESLKSLTEEIETLKTKAPKVEAVDLDEKTKKHFFEDYKDAAVAAMIFKKEFQDTLKFQSLPERAKAVDLNADFMSQVQDSMLKDVKEKSSFYPLFREVPSDVKTDTLPYTFGMTTNWGAATNAHWEPGKVTFSYNSIFGYTTFNYITDEESVITWLPTLRQDLTDAISEGIDKQILDAAASPSNTYRGIASYATGANYTEDVATAGKFTVDDFDAVRAKMGKYGVDPRNLVLALNPTPYLTFLTDDAVTSMEKYGAAATILTGELAKVRGVPVLVSEDAPYSAATGEVVAVLFNRKMFLTKMHSFIVETQKTITNQQMDIVGSVRVGFIPAKPLASGQINAPFAYAATNA